METLVKIAFIFLGIDILLVIGAIILLCSFIYKWQLYEQLEDTYEQLINEKKYDELTTKCNDLIDSNVKYKQYYSYNALAIKELKLRNYLKADEYASNAIKTMPGEIQAYKTMVDIHFQQKDVQKAFFYIIQSAAKSTLNYKMYLSSGNLFTYCQKYEEAIKMYELASSENDTSPVPMIAIAIVHYLNRNNNMAIDFIRQARTKINPHEDYHTQVNEWAKGLLAIMSGDIKEACYIFEYYSEESDFGPIFDIILEKIKKVFRSD